MATFGQIQSNEEAVSGIGTKAIVGAQGVNDPAHLKVTERGAGANMSVDVASGTCYIDQADGTMRESSTTATTNLAIASNSSGSTRVDLIVIEPDTAPRVEEGTPGSGTPAIPADTFALAEVSVADGATSITNANITDRREYCGLFRKARGEVAFDDTSEEDSSDQIISTTATLTGVSITRTMEQDRRFELIAQCSFREGTGATTWSVPAASIQKDSSSFPSSFRGYIAGQNGSQRVSGTVDARDIGDDTSHTYTILCSVLNGDARAEKQSSVRWHLLIKDMGSPGKPTGSTGQ